MSWLLVQTIPGFETAVWPRAEQKFYTPVAKRLTKPKGKRQPVEISVALFPGYFFIEYDYGTRNVGVGWFRFLRAAGSDDPLLFQDDFINYLRQFEAAVAEARKIEDIPVSFSIGDLVKVIDGVLSGAVVVVLQFLSIDSVLVDMKGKKIRLSKRNLRPSFGVG